MLAYLCVCPYCMVYSHGEMLFYLQANGAGVRPEQLMTDYSGYLSSVFTFIILTD